MNTESYQCTVLPTYQEAQEFGKGGLAYQYKEGSDRNFPEDVTHVCIMMPYDWKDAEVQGNGVMIPWDTKRWMLTGTHDKPTLYPSLHWIDHWHGWLKDGFLRSC